MVRLGGIILVVFAALLIVNGSSGQDTKLKGVLPANWGKIGLSDEQKQKVYKVQADFNDQISKLEAQLKEAKTKEKAEMEKVLTDAQKARLREILLSTLPKEEEKKKDDK